MSSVSEKGQVYKCSRCGNIVEVTHVGGGHLVCCGEAMDLLNENTTEAAVEKHIPVVEKIDGGYKVSVGSTLHPMGDDHLITWIELVAEGLVYRKDLGAGDAPVAEFKVDAASVYARAYCNLHGLWKSE